MIKVAFIIDSIYSPTAGTEKQLLLLLNALSRDVVEPCLFCLHSSPWLENAFTACPWVNLDIASLKSVNTPARILQFRAILRRHNIDVIQTHFIDSNYAGILAAKLAGVKAIISTRRGMPYWRNPFELFLLRILNRAVDVFVANSQWSASSYGAAEGIPPDKMKIIYNGINIADFPIDDDVRAASRAQLEVDSNTRIVGIVANLRPIKRIDVFLRAAARIKSQSRNVRFIVVGEGEARNELMALAGELGLQSDVTFMGQREDIPRLLSAFDIGVLSSQSESLSNSIIEYSAASLPVVCTDVGGAKETIVDGATGFLVPPGDADVLADRIVRLLANPSMRQMGVLGRKRVQDLFSISSMARQYEELYRQMANSAS
jgi:L-malate glycosyltransferase